MITVLDAPVSFKLSDLNGSYFIKEKNGYYKWELPTGNVMLLVVGTAPELNFAAPNLLARQHRIFEFKHSRTNGSKFWTSKIGVEYVFAIPLDQIELIPEPAYSYVKVRINGREFVLNVSGGTGFIAGENHWTDLVRSVAFTTIISLSPIKVLNCLSEVALPFTEVPENLRGLYKVQEHEQDILRQLANDAVPDMLQSGNKIYLGDGYSIGGCKELKFDRRIRKTRLTQSMVCDGSVKVKFNQVDWIKTAALNNITLKIPDGDFSLI